MTVLPADRQFGTGRKPRCPLHQRRRHADQHLRVPVVARVDPVGNLAQFRKVSRKSVHLPVASHQFSVPSSHLVLLTSCNEVAIVFAAMQEGSTRRPGQDI